jgi:hypothetical protein
MALDLDSLARAVSEVSQAEEPAADRVALDSRRYLLNDEVAPALAPAAPSRRRQQKAEPAVSPDALFVKESELDSMPFAAGRLQRLPDFTRAFSRGLRKKAPLPPEQTFARRSSVDEGSPAEEAVAEQPVAQPTRSQTSPVSTRRSLLTQLARRRFSRFNQPQPPAPAEDATN